MAFKMMGWSPFNKPSDNKKAGDIYDKAFAMDSSKIDYSKYKNVDLSKGLRYSYGKTGPVDPSVKTKLQNQENVIKKFGSTDEKSKKQTTVKPKSKNKKLTIGSNYTYQDYINNQNNPKGKSAPKPTKSTKNKRSIWAKGDIKPQTTMKGGKTGEITELDIKAYGASGKPQSQRHKK